jgi:hypothetical protein
MIVIECEWSESPNSGGIVANWRLCVAGSIIASVWQIEPGKCFNWCIDEAYTALHTGGHEGTLDEAKAAVLDALGAKEV